MAARTIAELFGTDRPSRAGRKDRRQLGRAKRLVPAPPTAPPAPTEAGTTTIMGVVASGTGADPTINHKAHPKPIETCVVERVLPRHQNKQLPHLPPIRRNDRCPCGSGRKWKVCHGGSV